MIKHEDLHQADYEREAINPAKNEIKKRFKGMWKPTCEDFKGERFQSNIEELKNQGRDQYIGILKGKDENDKKSYQSRLEYWWNLYTHQEEYKFYDPENYRYGITDSYEQFTQGRLWGIIKDYKDELKKRVQN